MQDGPLAADGDEKRISGATGKDAENGISGGGYKNQRRKKEMTIPNNPEFLYQPLRKLGGVGGGRQQQ